MSGRGALLAIAEAGVLLANISTSKSDSVWWPHGKPPGSSSWFATDRLGEAIESEDAADALAVGALPTRLRGACDEVAR